MATVIWSYPRGREAITKDGETAIDIAAYAAQIAALIGAHIIKRSSFHTDHLMLPEAKKVYEDIRLIDGGTGPSACACMQAPFNGRRIVVFSGQGGQRDADAVYDDAAPSATAAANGSIIGGTASSARARMRWRCCKKLVDIYLGKA